MNAFRTDGDGLPYLDSFNASDYDAASDNADPRLFPDCGHARHTYMFNPNYIMDNSAVWSRSNGLYGYYVSLKHNVDPDGQYLVKGSWWGSPMNRIVLRYADVLLMRRGTGAAQSGHSAGHSHRQPSARARGTLYLDDSRLPAALRRAPQHPYLHRLLQRRAGAQNRQA